MIIMYLKLHFLQNIWEDSIGKRHVRTCAPKCLQLKSIFHDFFLNFFCCFCVHLSLFSSYLYKDTIASSIFEGLHRKELVTTKIQKWRWLKIMLCLPHHHHLLSSVTFWWKWYVCCCVSLRGWRCWWWRWWLWHRKTSFSCQLFFSLLWFLCISNNTQHIDRVFVSLMACHNNKISDKSVYSLYTKVH